MKIVNTSKSIYNTVLMIVTINTLVIPPIPNRIKNLLNPISIPHTRRYRQKLNLTIIEIKTRNIRSLNFSSINEYDIRATFSFFSKQLFSPSFLSLCLVHHSQFQYHRSTKTNGKKQTYLDLHKLPITFHNRSPSTTYDNTPIPIILFTASATDPASFLARLFPSTTARAKLSIGFVPASQLVLGITRNERMRRGEEEEKKIPRDVACTRESSCPTL